MYGELIFLKIITILCHLLEARTILRRNPHFKVICFTSGTWPIVRSAVHRLKAQVCYIRKLIKTGQDLIFRVIESCINVTHINGDIFTGIADLLSKFFEGGPAIFRGFRFVPLDIQGLSCLKHRPGVFTNDADTIHEFPHVAITLHNPGIHHTRQLADLINIGTDNLAANCRTLNICAVQHVFYPGINTKVAHPGYDLQRIYLADRSTENSIIITIFKNQAFFARDRLLLC